MWKQWVVSMLGSVFIIAPFLGLTTFIFKTTMALGGVVFCVLGFWILSESRLASKKTDDVSHDA
ncbi:MAG: hypothetical protein AAB522_00710 [Patescibacteria group bacterium]